MRPFSFPLPALLAGFVAVLVGYASSAAIIWQAASAAGASEAQIAGWMTALGLAMGVSTLALTLWYRVPLLTAWSTPGAALLATSLHGVSINEAVGVFIFANALILLCGLTGLFARLMKIIPHSLAAAMLGGIDPSNPKTIDRFTKEVERLAAWNKVEHLGNGLFMIDYSTKGRLADDFAFPVIPRYALGNPMIHVTRWDNGRVRIEAPTFHNDADVSLMSLMGAGSMIPGMGSKKSIEPVEVKGTFTIRTNAKVLANNTDEGPIDEGVVQVLRWDIGPKTFGPPMALLQMAK